MFKNIGNKISELAYRMNQNIHLSIIRDTFVQIMPLTMIASFSFLGTILITSRTTGLAALNGFEFLENFSIIFNTINYAGLNLISIYTAFIMGQLYGEHYESGGKITGLLSVMAYVSISPVFTSVKIDGTAHIVSGVLPNAVTNAQGLFLAMLVAFGTSLIFRKLIKVKSLQIKLPDSVPANIFSAFNILIPAFITIIVVVFIGFIPVITTKTYLGDLIYKIIQTPLQNVANSTMGVVIITFASLIFWAVGIHGNQVISPIRAPITAAALAANVAAVQAGTLPNQPFTMTFWFSFISLGGSGITISLLAAILVFSKREEYRQIAKLSAVPGLFGINEPAIFGLPIVLNPTLIIPFVISGCVAAAIAMVAHSIGFLTASVISIPFGLPILVSGFVGYGINGVIVQAIILVVSFIIYGPFVKLSNKQISGDLSV